MYLSPSHLDLQSTSKDVGTPRILHVPADVQIDKFSIIIIYAESEAVRVTLLRLHISADFAALTHNFVC